MAVDEDSPILVADIGGTNARFAVVEHPGAPLREQCVLPCADYPSLEDAAQNYLDGLNARPRRAAVAVATALTGDRVRMTNHVWSFSVKEVRRRLGLEELRVLNDFTALALAIPRLAEDELYKVGAGEPVAGTPMAVIGPGTGLGVSGLIPAGDRYIPLHSEGGHVTYGAASEYEGRILAIIGHRFGHVSAERLVSGPGLVNLYMALAQVHGVQVDTLEPAEITSRALADDCGICREALDTFCSILGTAAGNLVLTLGARAGVYIGGGIVPRLGDYFARSPFRAAFEHRGRFSKYLAAIPSYVITAELPALRGSAHAFAYVPHEVGLCSHA